MQVLLLPFLALAASMTAKLTTREQREAFERDGYIIVSGLLTESELDDLVSAGKLIMEANEDNRNNPFFSVMEKGVILQGPGVKMTEESKAVVVEKFRRIALFSKIPQVATELMGMDEGVENVRLLRDVFLGKSLDDPKACQWHVDDSSFWPESFQSTGGHGVNAWIALDDMPYGGSLGLSPGSHKAEWRERGYRALGQDHSSPGKTKEQQFKDITEGFSTCSMDIQDKELHSTLEKSSYFPKLNRGDIIFHTRMLYHKTTPLAENAKEKYRKLGLSSLNRYSIRYVSGKATLPLGYVSELSILADRKNEGRTLDEVCEKDGPWYPKVWPVVEADLDMNLLRMASKFAVGKANEKAQYQEFIEKLRALKAASVGHKTNG